MKTYKVTILQGVDAGNTEWWTEEDWDNWREYVKRLKRTGEYGKPAEFEIMMKENPLFDSVHSRDLCAHKVIMLDFRN